MRAIALKEFLINLNISLFLIGSVQQLKGGRRGTEDAQTASKVLSYMRSANPSAFIVFFRSPALARHKYINQSTIK